MLLQVYFQVKTKNKNNNKKSERKRIIATTLVLVPQPA